MYFKYFDVLTKMRYYEIIIVTLKEWVERTQ